MPMGLQCIKPELAARDVDDCDLGLTTVKAEEPVSERKPRAIVKDLFVMIILKEYSVRVNDVFLCEQLLVCDDFFQSADGSVKAQLLAFCCCNSLMKSRLFLQQVMATIV